MAAAAAFLVYFCPFLRTKDAKVISKYIYQSYIADMHVANKLPLINVCKSRLDL